MKYANYFSSLLEVADHWCFDITRVFFKIIEGFNFSRGIVPTIIVGKLLGLVSQAHRRPQPGPPRPCRAQAPGAGQRWWGQCAAPHPPSPALSSALKGLSEPLPPPFSPLAASLMIQLGSENREMGYIRGHVEGKLFSIADKEVNSLVNTIIICWMASVSMSTKAISWPNTLM